MESRNLELISALSISVCNASLGKRVKIVYQGLWRFLRRIQCTVFTEFPYFDREWNHNGITESNFNEFVFGEWSHNFYA